LACFKGTVWAKNLLILNEEKILKLESKLDCFKGTVWGKNFGLFKGTVRAKKSADFK